MALRERHGQWHYRFKVSGHEYTGPTGLAATKRNRTAAQQIEAEAHRMVTSGQALTLRIDVMPFKNAAQHYLEWTRGEYREHPATALRIRTSFTSLGLFFGRYAVNQITAGSVEDFKTWRRRKHQVREITIRHDLHALSAFFRHALKHNWCRTNPVRDVTIPSDADAVRMYILSAAEEELYFATAQARGNQNLFDLGRLMLLHGCRPEELLALETSAVDLLAGYLTIRQGKTAAARRTLKLTDESRRILSRRMGGRWVFPSAKIPGAHLTKLNNAHNAVLRVTGLHFVLYDLRHTFATRAAALGVPLPSLAAILGHANLRSIAKYIHPTQAHMDAAMERLDSWSAFGPPPSLEAAPARAQVTNWLEIDRCIQEQAQAARALAQQGERPDPYTVLWASDWVMEETLLRLGRTKPIAVDLCCGSGGWTKGLQAAGFRCIGFDVQDFGYPGDLVLQDVRTVDGRPMRGKVHLIVASPPCQEFSRHDQPWTRRWTPPQPDTSIWRACLRIAEEAEAPIVLENVRGAQKFMGRAAWHVGPYYLWGNVPALMPTIHARKDFYWWGREGDRSATVVGRTKQSRSSTARAQRSEIPFELASYVGRVFAETQRAGSSPD